MNENEQIPVVQSLLQRPIVVASVTSLVSLVFFYWVARRAVSQLEVWWVEFLAYAIIPMAVAFIILYRSCWHREITGAARTCSLLVLSGVIFGGDLIAIGAVLCLALLFICMIAFGANAFTGGNH
jgi:hypothetical protein